MKKLLMLLGMAIGASVTGVALAAGTDKKRLTALNPVKGTVTSPFNAIRSGNTRHNGIDVAVPVGTPVYAPLDGEVYQTYYNSAGGNQIVIMHANGWRTGYAHLSKIVVSPKQKVQRGQIIAYSGNTGQSTGPHLHFTLTINGVLVNPATYFSFQ
jgi:murein DD-endopeptidase MepM/ murein hydrolase activator NlpD